MNIKDGRTKGINAMTTGTETIIRHAEDDIECVCGNRPHMDGFALVDLDGTYREGEYGPTPEWDNDTMACRQCGRIFSLTSLMVSGQTNFDDAVS